MSSTAVLHHDRGRVKRKKKKCFSRSGQTFSIQNTDFFPIFFTIFNKIIHIRMKSKCKSLCLIDMELCVVQASLISVCLAIR